MKKKSPRKRGAQPNNKNAVKHGFWANWKTDQRTKGDLERLIAYLEFVIERLSETIDPLLLKDTLQDSELQKLTTLINTLMQVIDRYTNTIKILAYKNGEMNELEKEIEQGLFLARQSQNVLTYLETSP